MHFIDISKEGYNETAFTKDLQRRMEGVVLNLPNGSYAQRVQAEYLKEIEDPKGVLRTAGMREFFNTFINCSYTNFYPQHRPLIERASTLHLKEQRVTHDAQRRQAHDAPHRWGQRETVRRNSTRRDWYTDEVVSERPTQVLLDFIERCLAQIDRIPDLRQSVAEQDDGSHFAWRHRLHRHGDTHISLLKAAASLMPSPTIATHFLRLKILY